MNITKYSINYYKAWDIMGKMEIELTPEQEEKVEILNSNGISVGQAIDMLFEAKEETSSLFDNLDLAINAYEKVKDSALDFESKQEILKNEYGDSDKTYEMRVQDVKHSISWAKDFFKF